MGSHENLSSLVVFLLNFRDIYPFAFDNPMVTEITIGLSKVKINLNLISKGETWLLEKSLQVYSCDKVFLLH